MIRGSDIVKFSTQGSMYDRGTILNAHVRRPGTTRLEKCRINIEQLMPLIQNADFEEEKKRKYVHLTLMQ